MESAHPIPPPSSARPPSLPLSEWLQILRAHALPAGVVLLVVTGYLTWRTLHEVPVYTTAARLHLEDTTGDGGVLSDLAALESPSQIETEMVIMRSRQVARGAARVLGLAGPLKDLSPEEIYPPGDTAPPLDHAPVRSFEPSAWSPLAKVLQAWGRRSPPAPPLVLRTPPLAADAPPIGYELAFAGDSKSVEILAPGLAPARAALSESQTFAAHGRQFHVVAPELSALGGRRFVVEVLSEEGAAEWIRGGASTTPVGRRTGVVDLAFSDRTPHLAEQVAGALATSYLALRRQRRTQQAVAGLQWLESEFERIQSEFRTAEQARDAFVSRQGALQLDARATWLLEALAEIDVQISEIGLQERELREQGARLSSWQASQGDLEKKIRLLGDALGGPFTASLASDYAALMRRKEALIAGGHTAESPPLQETSLALGIVRRHLETAVDEQIELSRAKVAAEVSALKARREEIGGRQERWEEELRALPALERELARHQRAVNSLQRVLETLTERISQVQIAGASSLTAARLVDAPVLPRVRASPRLFHRLILAFLFGALAGIGLAILRHRIEPGVRSAREVEDALRLPLYASIPAFASVPRRDRLRAKSPLVAVDRPDSLLAEGYRTLRMNLRYADGDKEVRSVAVTSAMPQEGKTTTLLNLAVSCAQAGQKVLLIDADLRRPTTHKFLERSAEPGLVDVLTGVAPWQEACGPTIVPGLVHLPAGARTDRPWQLLDSPEFPRLLGELRGAFDLLLVDSPPVLPASETASFLSHLDGVLLVVRWRRSKLDVIAEARDRLVRRGARLLGVVFNGEDLRRSGRRDQGYRYGSGYSAPPKSRGERRRRKEHGPRSPESLHAEGATRRD